MKATPIVMNATNEMCDRCVVLERQLAQIRSILDGAAYATEDEAHDLAWKLKITYGQAAIVAVLYNARFPVSAASLHDSTPRLNRTSDDPAFSTIRAQIHYLRANLGKTFIETVGKSTHQSAYRLSDEGRKKVAQALNEQG